MLRNLLRKKPIGHTHEGYSLHRTLTAFDLTLMGIGAIIGAGVFVLTGIAAATKAGPGVVFSFILAGIASMLAALAYAELASSIGGTGSAYSYAYAGFGEFIAWMLGWNLILEYVMSVSTVAIGWSGYVLNFFEAIHVHIPTMFTHNPFEGGVINLVAFGIIMLLACLLSLGAKKSARFNSIIVFVKLATIAFFVVVASLNIKAQNWMNFLPFGWTGVVQGAALVFFAYVGFDALSTAVEEAVEPQRNIPIAIIASLIVCILIYIIVAGLLTGMVPYTTLNVRSPVADAMLTIGYHTAAVIIAVGAIAGLTTVMLVMYYGLTRILLAISLDGLLPRRVADVNPSTLTPVKIIFITGTIIALISGFAPIDRAAELVNIGTLAAFVFVCAGVILFRYTHPDLPRPFKLPFNPVIPTLGVIFCVYLMLHLPLVTWIRFIIWTVAGVLIYFCYGMKHSRLRAEQQ